MSFELRMVLGTLILLASSAAFADEGLTLAPPAEVIGRYRVSAITETDKDYSTDACVPHKSCEGEDQDADRRCGTTVLLVRAPGQLAILRTPTAARLTAAIFDGGACDIHADAAQAQTALFGTHSRFCRAFAVQGAPGTETYLYNESADPKGPDAHERAMRGSYTSGLGILGLATASDFKAELPQGERSPRQITVTERIEGTETLIFIPMSVHWQNVMTLTYAP